MLTGIIFLLIGGVLLGCAAVMTAVVFVAILFGCLKGFSEASKFLAGFVTRPAGYLPGKITPVSESLSNVDLSLN